jgi:diguanylate cyclase (GGDEF)-like protein/PAS domain S-box-containing protein
MVSRLISTLSDFWDMNVHIPKERKDWFAQKQMRAFFNASKRTVPINYTIGVFFAPVGLVMSGVYAALFITTVAFLTSLARSMRTESYYETVQNQETTVANNRWIKLYCTFTGAAWGMCFAVCFHGDLSIYSGALAILVPAMMFAGSFSTDTVYNGAVRYALGLTSIACAGLIATGLWANYFMAACLIFYCILDIWKTRMSYVGFVSRNISKVVAEESSDTVHLLLNDYEEHSCDWLWEVSTEGAIRRPSPRFANVLNCSEEDLIGKPLIALLDQDHDRSVLHRLLAKGESFRDLVVKVDINGEDHWWSLSGRAMTDKAGVVTGMRGVASDVTAAKRAEAKIAYMAHYDGLCDLPNRLLFNETLTRALNRRADTSNIAMLYLDLDHFKSINDTLGHSMGDKVLKIAAKRIESCLGIHDMVARFGGDEFAVLLSDFHSKDDVTAIAQNIVDAMDEIVLIDDQKIVIGASIGIAFAPEDAHNTEDLIKNADLALYNAKENGRRGFSLFDISMHEAMQAKRLIEIDLRAAIGRNQLELYYQPLINLENEQIIGYEALLRWNHDEHGMIMPDTFIPIAEDTGLIIQLGEWVIRNALIEVTRWPEELSVSVNLSPSQMRSPNLLPTIVNALAATGVASNRLELEITESVFMHDSEANIEILHQIRALGVRIALDDFGTGYSSLNYLRAFPFDKIKIDRCFVDEVDSRADSRAIVRAVTGLASTLGMVTTAEGVERFDQLEELKREGCTEVQGYFFSRPVPAGQLADRVMEDVDETAKVHALTQRIDNHEDKAPLRRAS